MQTIFALRPAQLAAIKQTFKYYRANISPREYLWNIKPRFGKTRAAYEFIHQIEAKRILIITNRPAAMSAWQEEFRTFQKEHPDYLFATKANRQKIIATPSLSQKPLIYFTSLQDLKGEHGNKPANSWVFNIKKPWDLIIIDESHEGVKTVKASRLLGRLKCDFTLYLSGTPFRALADADFSAQQIFNYTYLDEQTEYTSHPEHFSLALPQFHFHLADAEEYADDYLGDRWLSLLANDLTEHRHSFWLLSSIAECHNMEQKLSAHPRFKNHTIIVAAGGKERSLGGKKIIKKVQDAILNAKSGRTITLSCGQLTTGVTVPEWSAVVMLYSSTDIGRASASSYLQAAFRAASPHPGKTQAHVFDFQPLRALSIICSYAENLANDSLEAFLKYSQIEYYKSGAWKKLSHEDVIELPKSQIARSIVASNFSSPTDIFAEPDFSLSADVAEVIAKLDRYHKGRVVKSRQTTHIKPAIRSTLHTPAPRSHHGDAHQVAKQKILSLTRSIPFLLHIAKSANTLTAAISQIDDEVFAEITGTKPRDFQTILESGILNIEHLDLATAEFYRQQALAKNCLSLLPASYQSHIITSPKLADSMANSAIRALKSKKNWQDITILDPYSKSGSLLASTLQHLYELERPSFQDDRTCLLHILSQQLFAFCPSKSACEITIHTLLHALPGSTYSPDEYSKIELFKSHIIIKDPLLQKGGNDLMKFDVIISNPPYQKGRRQIYADFYKLAVDLNPEILCMVFPIGWQKTYNHNGLGQINNAHYKRDPHIVSIDHYYESGENKLFPEIGTGGVNIVLRKRMYDNHGKIQKLEYGIATGDMVLPLDSSDIEKPVELTCILPLLENLPKVSHLGSARKPYGFYADPLRDPAKYHLALQDKKLRSDDVKLFGLNDEGARAFKYIARSSLPKVSPLIDSFKLFVPKAWGNMSERIGLGGSFANIVVADPGDVCSESFIEFGSFGSREEAIRMAKYFMTQFFRALLFLAKDSQNTTRDKYKFIPVPDLSANFWQKNIHDLDEELFELYHVPNKSRDYIRKHIQTRTEKNIELIYKMQNR